MEDFRSVTSIGNEGISQVILYRFGTLSTKCYCSLFSLEFGIPRNVLNVCSSVPRIFFFTSLQLTANKINMMCVKYMQRRIYETFRGQVNLLVPAPGSKSGLVTAVRQLLRGPEACSAGKC